MRLEELLDNRLLFLPKNWVELGYDSYYDCVIQEGQKFIELISKIDSSISWGNDELIGSLTSDHLLKAVKRCFEVVSNTLNCYLYEGNPSKAYEVFNHFMNNENEEIADSLVNYLEYTLTYPQYYRIRYKQEKADFSDLFHIPFDLRHKVSSNRYSIPGHPALYMTNSVFLAYNEIGILDYENLYVSKFVFANQTESHTLLDMTNNSLWSSPDSQFKFLCRWILTMSCSVKVAFPNSSFKAEYIIPQMLFLWVKNNMIVGKDKKVIGVQYSSTKIKDFNTGFFGHFYNIVLPAQVIKKSGFCPILSANFKITRPISLAKALQYYPKNIQQNQVKSIETYGVSVEYIETDFGRIEQVLNERPNSELFDFSGQHNS